MSPQESLASQPEIQTETETESPRDAAPHPAQLTIFDSSRGVPADAASVELPPVLTEVSTPRRIVNAAREIVRHTVTIIAKGDFYTAMREGANHL